MTDISGSTATPTDAQLLAGVEAAMQGGDMAAAGRLARQALDRGMSHPTLLSLVGYDLFAANRPADAVPYLYRAREMAPRDPNGLHLLALCLAATGRDKEAVGIFEETIAAAPDFAPARFNLGSVKQELGELDEARRLYREAIALQPNYPQALALLADLDAKAGRMDEARASAERALALDPDQFPAVSALAVAQMAQGDAEGAAARLEAAVARGLSPRNQAIAVNMLGDALDAQGRAEEAFEAYRRSKAQFHELYASRWDRADSESPLAHARRILPAFEAVPAAAWNRPTAPAPRDGAPSAHVFLVGFPRSGTTLLENVLSAHPQVVALEERDTLLQSWLDYMIPPHGLNDLANADDARLEQGRRAYWERVAALEVKPAGKVFIDKMPINTVQLPVIARLFPDAKILFARRDPRDVVLSCFRRRFGMNAFMYQLTTLEGTAAYYDAVMALASAYVARLPLKLHVVRYESLVEDFETQARAACAFVGLDWSEEVKDFAEKARQRSINTPSSAQVVKGLYGEGAGQWRRYRQGLAPVMDVLKPWVETLGYPTE